MRLVACRGLPPATGVGRRTSPTNGETHTTFAHTRRVFRAGDPLPAVLRVQGAGHAPRRTMHPRVRLAEPIAKAAGPAGDAYTDDDSCTSIPGRGLARWLTRARRTGVCETAARYLLALKNYKSQ
ncbi:hypothetical protein GCM10017687_01060 [Streptomyces echinatus]